MLEQARGGAGFAGGHGGRQIDQPARVDGESAHHFQRGRCVFLTNRDGAAQAGCDDPLAEHIIGVEQVIAGLLGGERGLGRLLEQERAGRLAVNPRGRNRHELAFRIAQGRQLAAEDATGVDVDRLVEPLRKRNRRVTVDDGSSAAIILGPVAPNRQAQIVGLARRFTIECKVAHPARGAALHRLFHSGMGDHQLAVVEHIVADQGIDKISQLGTEGAARLLPEARPARRA